MDEHIKADVIDDDELRVKLLGCTNSQGCPVHSMHQRPRWQYVDSNETLDKVYFLLLFILFGAPCFR